MTIYLDHNATSPASKEHLDAVVAMISQGVGNPSSPHALGRQASVLLTDSRLLVASALAVDASEVIFVSGGSEANNLATAQVIKNNSLPISEQHVVMSAIEHPCIQEPIEFLRANHGLQVTSIGSENFGRFELSDVLKAIRSNTTLVTFMAANNELGTLLPVKEFADFLNAARWNKTPPDLPSQTSVEKLRSLHFHVDAVQAFGKIRREQWMSLGTDSVSVCGHKIGGLSGVGALVLRKGRRFQPLIRGGAQERNRRAGTENVLGIVSLGLMAKAVSQPQWWESVESTRSQTLRIRKVVEALPGVLLNSPMENVLPNTLNFSIDLPQVNGEDVLMELDMAGICASSGSACSSGANLPSKILLATGRSEKQAKNAIRISLGPNLSESEIDKVCTVLVKILAA